MTNLQYYYFDSFIGKLTVVEENNILIYIGLPNVGLSKVKNWCESKLGKIEFELIDSLDASSFVQLDEYFNGRRKLFSLKYSILQTNFRKNVLKAVEVIPFGQTKSYAEIAELIGKPKAVRAAGTANATNPLPIVIPCHRVIAKNGGLGGYGGGLDMKIKLLEFEGWAG